MKNTIHTKITNYILTIFCKDEKEDAIKNSLVQKLKFHQISIKSFSTKTVDKYIQLDFQIEVENTFSEELDSIINKLCLEPGISSVKYSELSNYVDDDDDYEDK